MGEHEMQHAESPTWCIHCGTFDLYVATTPCSGVRDGAFDSCKPENAVRMFTRAFGTEPASR